MLNLRTVGRYIVTIGGHNEKESHKGIEIYDVLKRTRFYRNIPDLNDARAYHSCSVTKNWKDSGGDKVHAVVCAGGRDVASGKTIDSIETWKFRKFLSDQTANRWTKLEVKLRTARYAFALVHLGEKAFLAAGGVGEDGDVKEVVAEEFEKSQDVKETTKRKDIEYTVAFMTPVLNIPEKFLEFDVKKQLEETGDNSSDEDTKEDEEDQKNKSTKETTEEKSEESEEEEEKESKPTLSSQEEEEEDQGSKATTDQTQTTRKLSKGTYSNPYIQYKNCPLPKS